MQHLAVFLIVALAAMVASTRGLPTPATDQEGNTTSPASAETSTSNSGVKTECRLHPDHRSDCPTTLSCFGTGGTHTSCQDPCPGSCGLEAICKVVNHVPGCSCPDGMYGDPFAKCLDPAVPPRTRTETTQ